MSTHNIGFYEEMAKNIFQLSSNIIKYTLYLFFCKSYDLSRFVRKTAFCICENKDADQLRGNREADQRLCFRYIASTIPLLSKYIISSL